MSSYPEVALFEVGVAVVDVTPPLGLTMAGFAARTRPAESVHDPLTARALVVGDTAIVVVDVIGLERDFCLRVAARGPLPPENVVVAALHNHGGPIATPGRLGADPDMTWLKRLEDGCVEALTRATAARRPRTLEYGLGGEPGVAFNRRHANGPRDTALPLVVARDPDGAPAAIFCAYALHPVVLGPDNLAYTADFPFFTRRALERAFPGAVAVYATGCCGDVNTGHTAVASFALGQGSRRSFPEAERVGEAVARAALAAERVRVPVGGTRAARAAVCLDLARRESEPPAILAARWRAEAEGAVAGHAALLRGWALWADTVARRPLEPWAGHVSVLTWGDLRVVTLPGEIFGATATGIRRALGDDPAGGRTIVLGYVDGVPGYIPPADEYPFGGYEVDDAHRYYGMPASFAPGSAERLADAAVAIAGG